MKQTKNVKRIIHHIDASGQIAGRLASQVAILLMGKHKTSYRPNVDSGDFVEISNVGQLKFSGNKMEQKLYYRTSGYIGNLKTESLKKFFKEKPEALFAKVVKNMLPRNYLKPGRMKRLIFKK